MLTTSPAAIPSPASGRASTVTSASPVLTPIAHLDALVRRPVEDRERRADGALRVVLVRDGRAEDRHHRVADELLDGAAVALELLAHVRVVAAELGRDVLGVELLGPRREADQVGEQDGDDLALSPSRRH